MTDGSVGFMPLRRQLFARRMAEVLSELLSQRHTTPQRIARAYSLDRSTAENLRKGHLSVPTLEKVLRVEGWELWENLGREMFGHSYEQHLEHLVGELERAADEKAARRERVRKLEAQASAFGPL